MQKKYFIRITAVITLLAFVYSSILHQPAYAITEMVKDVAIEKDLKARLCGFVLPYRFGRIADGWLTESKNLVVWIQDLHCHPEVQKNIYQIIKVLDRDNRVSRIYLEGAPQGKLDSAFLDSIPNEKVKDKTVEKLMANGLLSGAEYYRIKNNKDKVYGLEDWQIYQENYLRARELLSKKEENLKVAREVAQKIEAVKNKYLSYEIKKLDKCLKSGVEKNKEDERFFFRLEKLGKKTGEDISWYPNLSRYLEMVKLARGISYRRLADEQNSFIREIRTFLPYKEYSILQEKVSKDRLEEFYYDLSEIQNRYGSHFDHTYSNLETFLRYSKLNYKINPIKLSAEEKLFSQRVLASSCTKLRDKEIIFMENMSRYLKSFVELNMSDEDLEEFQKNILKFKTLLVKYFGKEDLDLASCILDEKEIGRYYSLNVERNGIFLKNLSDRKSISQNNLELKGDGRDVLGKIDNFENIEIVVAGGFHSSSVEKLKEKGISCIVVTPNITKDYNRNLYENILEGNLKASDISEAALGVILGKILERGDIKEFENLIASVVAEMPKFYGNEIEIQKTIDVWLKKLKEKIGDGFIIPDVAIEAENGGYKLYVEKGQEISEFYIGIKNKRKIFIKELDVLPVAYDMLKTGLSQKERMQIERNSKGVFRYIDFIEKVKNSQIPGIVKPEDLTPEEYASLYSPTKALSNGYSLGMAEKCNLYFSTSALLHLDNFVIACNNFYKDAVWGRADDYLAKMCEDSEKGKKPIVFFLPNDNFREYEHHYTTEDIQWFINPKNQEKASKANVYYVTGLYDFLSKEEVEGLSLAEDLQLRGKILENGVKVANAINQKLGLLAKSAGAAKKASSPLNAEEIKNGLLITIGNVFSAETIIKTINDFLNPKLNKPQKANDAESIPSDFYILPYNKELDSKISSEIKRANYDSYKEFNGLGIDFKRNCRQISKILGKNLDTCLNTLNKIFILDCQRFDIGYPKNPDIKGIGYAHFVTAFTDGINYYAVDPSSPLFLKPGKGKTGSPVIVFSASSEEELKDNVGKYYGGKWRMIYELEKTASGAYQYLILPEKNRVVSVFGSKISAIKPEDSEQNNEISGENLREDEISDVNADKAGSIVKHKKENENAEAGVPLPVFASNIDDFDLKLKKDKRNIENPTISILSQISKALDRSGIKGQAIISIEGEAGSGKNFVSDLIKKNGLSQYKPEEIYVIDTDDYIGDYYHFEDRIKSVVAKARLIILGGVYVKDLYSNLKNNTTQDSLFNKIPVFRIILTTQPKKSRLRTIARDGGVDNFINSSTALEMNHLDFAKSVNTNSLMFLNNEDLPAPIDSIEKCKPGDYSFSSADIYGKLKGTFAYKISPDASLSLLAEIINGKAKEAGLKDNEDPYSETVSQTETILLYVSAVIRLLLRDTRSPVVCSLRQYEKGFKIVLDAKNENLCGGHWNFTDWWMDLNRDLRSDLPGNKIEFLVVSGGHLWGRVFGSSLLKNVSQPDPQNIHCVFGATSSIPDKKVLRRYNPAKLINAESIAKNSKQERKHNLETILTALLILISGLATSIALKFKAIIGGIYSFLSSMFTPGTGSLAPPAQTLPATFSAHLAQGSQAAISHRIITKTAVNSNTFNLTPTIHHLANSTIIHVKASTYAIIPKLLQITRIGRHLNAVLDMIISANHTVISIIPFIYHILSSISPSIPIIILAGIIIAGLIGMASSAAAAGEMVLCSPKKLGKYVKSGGMYASEFNARILDTLGSPLLENVNEKDIVVDGQVLKLYNRVTYWAVRKEDIPLLAKALGVQLKVQLKVRKKLRFEYLSKDEFACTPMELAKQFNEKASDLKRMFDDTFGLDKPEDSDSDLVSNGITFYRRTRGSNIVWAVKRTDIEAVGAAMGAALSGTLQKDEIACNGSGLEKEFYGEGFYLKRKFDEKFKLGKPENADADIMVQGVMFYRRVTNGFNVWAIKRADKWKLGGKAGFKVRKHKAKSNSSAKNQAPVPPVQADAALQEDSAVAAQEKEAVAAPKSGKPELIKSDSRNIKFISVYLPLSLILATVVYNMFASNPIGSAFFIILSVLTTIFGMVTKNSKFPSNKLRALVTLFYKELNAQGPMSPEIEALASRIEDEEIKLGLKSREDFITIRNVKTGVSYKIHTYAEQAGKAANYYSPEDGINELKQRIENCVHKPCVVLITGRPGTGKTYLADKIAEDGIGAISKEEIAVIHTDGLHLLETPVSELSRQLKDFEQRILKEGIKLVVLDEGLSLTIEDLKYLGFDLAGKIDIKVFKKMSEFERWGRLLKDEPGRYPGSFLLITSKSDNIVYRYGTVDEKEKEADIVIYEKQSDGVYVDDNGRRVKNVGDWILATKDSNNAENQAINKISEKLSRIDWEKEDMGLSGNMKEAGRDFRSYLTEIFTAFSEEENLGFELNKGLAEDFADKLSRLKNGSIKLLYVFGVIEEEDVKAFQYIEGSKRLNLIKKVPESSLKEIARKLSVNRSEIQSAIEGERIPKGAGEIMQSKQIPLEVCNYYSLILGIPFKKAAQLISENANFVYLIDKNVKSIEDFGRAYWDGPINLGSVFKQKGNQGIKYWRQKAEYKAGEKASEVGGKRNALKIVASRGTEGADAWISSNKALATEIINKYKIPAMITWLTVIEGKIKNSDDSFIAELKERSDSIEGLVHSKDLASWISYRFSGNPIFRKMLEEKKFEADSIVEKRVFDKFKYQLEKKDGRDYSWFAKQDKNNRYFEMDSDVWEKSKLLSSWIKDDEQRYLIAKYYEDQEIDEINGMLENQTPLFYAESWQRIFENCVNLTEVQKNELSEIVDSEIKAEHHYKNSKDIIEGKNESPDTLGYKVIELLQELNPFAALARILRNASLWVVDLLKKKVLDAAGRSEYASEISIMEEKAKSELARAEAQAIFDRQMDAEITISENYETIQKEEAIEASIEIDREHNKVEIIPHKAFLDYVKDQPENEQKGLLEALVAQEIYEHYALKESKSIIYSQFGAFVQQGLHLGAARALTQPEVAEARTNENFHKYLTYLAFKNEQGSADAVEQELIRNLNIESQTKLLKHIKWAWVEDQLRDLAEDKDAEYGMERTLSETGKNYRKAIKSLLTGCGLAGNLAEGAADTIARMKPGSIRLMEILGVTNEEEAELLGVNDEKIDEDLSSYQKRPLYRQRYEGRMDRLNNCASAKKADLGKKIKDLVEEYYNPLNRYSKDMKRMFIRRLIKPESLEYFMFRYGLGRSQVKDIINGQNKFFIWFKEAAKAVNDIRTLYPEINKTRAWEIVKERGVENALAVAGERRAGVANIMSQYPGTSISFAWAIVNRLPGKDPVTIAGQIIAKVDEIKGQYPEISKSHAWDIVFEKGVEVTLEEVGAIISAVADIIAQYQIPQCRAWDIVLHRGWENAVVAAGELKDIADEIMAQFPEISKTNAWQITTAQRTKKTDPVAQKKAALLLVNKLSLKVAEIIRIYPEITKGNAWRIVINKGVKKALLVAGKMNTAVSDIMKSYPEIERRNAWAIAQRVGADKAWTHAGEIVAKADEILVSYPEMGKRNALRLLSGYGTDGIDEWLVSIKPEVDRISEANGNYPKAAWNEVIENSLLSKEDEDFMVKFDETGLPASHVEDNTSTDSDLDSQKSGNDFLNAETPETIVSEPQENDTTQTAGQGKKKPKTIKKQSSNGIIKRFIPAILIFVSGLGALIALNIKSLLGWLIERITSIFAVAHNATAPPAISGVYALNSLQISLNIANIAHQILPLQISF